MPRIRASRLRIMTVLLFFGLTAFGLTFKTGIGTLCNLGYGSISAICPLGALETALAGRIFPLRTLLSLGVAVIIVAIFGRFFCAWICPAPIFRGLILGNKKPESNAVLPVEKPGYTVAALEVYPQHAKFSLDSRHYILGSALLSSVFFGFPVFCLVCPVGLILATFIGVWRLFQYNEPSWMLLVFPAIFTMEIVICRKWCRNICPLGALLSLLSGLNPLFHPRVNRVVCRQVSQNMDCMLCKSVCEENIDLHNNEKSRPVTECTKCRECAGVCPAGAISFPLLSGKRTASRRH